MKLAWREATRPLELLRQEPDFTRYLVSKMISLLGSSMAPIAMSFAVLDQFGATGLSAVLVAQLLPQAIFSLLGGALGDRFSRRRLVVVANVGMGLAQATAAVLLFANWGGLLAISVTQIAFGVLRAFSLPAAGGWIRDLVPAGSRQQANALLTVGRDAAQIAGPLLGGLGVALSAPGAALAADAASFFIAALVMQTIRDDASVKVQDGNLWRDLKAGVGYVAGTPWLRLMIGASMIYQATLYPTVAIAGPLLFKEHPGYGVENWAIVLSSQAAGALVGAAVLLYFRPRRVLVWHNLLLLPDALFLVLLACYAPVWAVAVVAFLAMAGAAMSDALWFTVLQEEVQEDMISRVWSINWVGALCLAPAGLSAIGVLMGQGWAVVTLLGAAVIHVLVRFGAAFLPSIQRITQETAR